MTPDWLTMETLRLALGWDAYLLAALVALYCWSLSPWAHRRLDNRRDR